MTLILLVLVGLLYVAYMNSQRWVTNQFFAFVTKLAEAYGFFCIMSIGNILIGLPMVYAAQYANLHQRKSEEGEYLADFRERLNEENSEK